MTIGESHAAIVLHYAQQRHTKAQMALSAVLPSAHYATYAMMERARAVRPAPGREDTGWTLSRSLIKWLPCCGSGAG